MKTKNYKTHPKTTTFQKFVLIFLGIILGLVLFEIYLYLTDLDLKLLENQLYYQHADIEVHEISENANRLYGLRPNSSHTYFNKMHPLEINYASRNVTINNLGFRDSNDYTTTKANNIFRIIIVGGSITYGALVNDEDTYPRLLQEKLDTIFPNKFEVWNAGISAYAPSQKISYGSELIRKFKPDLIIIEDHSDGRKVFLWEEKFLPLLKKNKELLPENIPLLFSGSKYFTKIHYFLVQKIRWYRFIIVTVNGKLLSNGNKDFTDNYKKYGNKINEREYNNFFEENQNLSIILFNSIDSDWCEEIEIDYSNINCFILPFDTKPSEYSNLHPPSYVYMWYAEELTKYLEDNYFLNTSLLLD